MTFCNIFSQGSTLLILHHEVNVIIAFINLKYLKYVPAIHEYPLNLNFFDEGSHFIAAFLRDSLFCNYLHSINLRLVSFAFM